MLLLDGPVDLKKKSLNTDTAKQRFPARAWQNDDFIDIKEIKSG